MGGRADIAELQALGHRFARLQPPVPLSAQPLGVLAEANGRLLPPAAPPG